MAKINQTLEWNEIDPATLQPEVAKAYQAYKAQYAKAKEARTAFENMANETVGLPSTHRLAFSYNFGKLSMAVATAEPTKSAGSKAIAFNAIKVA